LRLECVDLKRSGHTLDCYIRAWQDGRQIGFGPDGTVDAERVRIVNVPMAVHDPAGTILRLDQDGKAYFLRLDPDTALWSTLAHVIGVKREKRVGGADIVPGRIGRTTTTAFPNAGTGTSPNDANVSRSGADEAWATIVAGAGTGAADAAASANAARVRASTTTDQYEALFRGSYGFDTTPVGTDTISSATLSVFLSAGAALGLGDDTVEVVSSAPANEADHVAGDYANFGSTSFGQISTMIGLSTVAYTDITLNASGISHIDGAANTIYGLRLGDDVSGTASWTWSSAGQSGIQTFFADQAGTDNDPKLVVEHAAAAGGPVPGGLGLLGVGI
jgi:hypothetical protein